MRARLLLVALVLAAVALVGQPAGASAAPTRTASPARTTTTSSATSSAASTVAARQQARRHHRSSKVMHALRIAKRKKGDPYSYGAAGPNRFDCSGLVYFSTHHAGFGHVPRTSSAQSHFMRHIRRKAMRPGDFIFFRSGGSVYHVGIFVGRHHGRVLVLHAPRPGERVHIERMWTNAWFPGTLRG